MQMNNFQNTSHNQNFFDLVETKVIVPFPFNCKQFSFAFRTRKYFFSMIFFFVLLLLKGPSLQVNSLSQRDHYLKTYEGDCSVLEEHFLSLEDVPHHTPA